MRMNILAATVMTCSVAVICPPAIAADDGFADNTLTGDWGGVRQRLHDDGVDLGADYVGEFAHNSSGGFRRTDAYADQIHLRAAFDFGKLWGWTGASLHIDVTNRNGNQLDQKAGLGTLLETQEIHGAGNVTRLTRFYYEQALWNDLVDIKFGRMDIGDDFFSFSCNFQNLNFCGSLPGYITKGWYDWPVSQTGGVLRLRPNAAWSLKLGAFDVNSNNAATSQGLKLSPAGRSQGTLMLAELEWDTALAGNATDGRPLAGSWRLGGWHNSANYPDLFSDVGGMPPGAGMATPRMRGHVSGTYAMGQQQITHNAAGGGLSLFGNLVLADSATDLIDQMVSAGLFYDAPFASRPHDRIGFVIGRDHVSRHAADNLRAQNAQGLQSLPIPGYEYITELNYNVQLWRGLSLMPNLQYIHHPGGSSGNANAGVLGLRVAATF